MLLDQHEPDFRQVNVAALSSLAGNA